MKLLPDQQAMLWGEYGLITVYQPVNRPLLDYRAEDRTETHLIYYFADIGHHESLIFGCKVLRDATNDNSDGMPPPYTFPTTRFLIEGLRERLQNRELRASKKMIRGGILVWLASHSKEKGGKGHA